MRAWFAISLVLTVVEAIVMGYIGFRRRDLLLERIPIHWDINMQPDGWTTPENFGWYLLMSPGVMLLITLMMVVLPLVSPKNFEIEPFAGTFGFAMTSLVAFFGWMGALILWAGVQENPAFFSQCFVASFFGLFAVLGNVMGKVKRNYWMGIRTPWTLSSEAVWNRTHRVAAWLWFGVGIIGGAAVLLGAPMWLGFSAIIFAAIVPIFYSLYLYKTLPMEPS